jgi:ubiquinone biosynthesis protein
VHFRAGYVPGEHDRAAFAQALRAVGEPIFGRAVADVSMNRLLTQLFEITGLFDMHLRPELVLLQKTMVTVEGVARGLDPDLDIWRATEPVVRRWIARELSPVNRIRDLGEQARDVLARLAARSTPAPTPQVATKSGFDGASFALGVLTAAVAFATAWLLR